MKKNALRTSMFSLCLILLSAVVLNSCREEFIAANHHREKNITIKRLTKKDLDTNPKLSGKLSKLNALPSVNGVAHRTYTNAQNGFTVETDEFVFIENGGGVKTYTFKIERPNTTASENAPLENLVLTEISGDSLKAEIWKYDQKILNKQNPTENDAKNYINISSIGNLGSNEVFGKLTMYDCMEPVVTVVTTPGSMCSEGYHTWAQFISGVKCIAETKPTPDQYDVVFTMNTGPCKDTGGGSGTLGDAGGGYGGGSSTPYPGGGSMPDFPQPDNSCERIKNVLELSVFESNHTYLKGKTGETYESGFRMNLFTPNTADNQLLQNFPGRSELDMTTFRNTYGLIHSHYDDLFPIFSPRDIYLFNHWVDQVIQNNQIDNPLIPAPPLKEIFFTVVSSENITYTLMYDETVMLDKFSNLTDDDFKGLDKTYIDYLSESMSIANVSGEITYNMNKLEGEFLKFVRDKMNMPGLKLYKTDKDGKTEEVYLSNNKRKTNKCP